MDRYMQGKVAIIATPEAIANIDLEPIREWFESQQLAKPHLLDKTTPLNATEVTNIFDQMFANYEGFTFMQESFEFGFYNYRYSFLGYYDGDEMLPFLRLFADLGFGIESKFTASEGKIWTLMYWPVLDNEIEEREVFELSEETCMALYTTRDRYDELVDLLEEDPNRSWTLKQIESYLALNNIAKAKKVSP
jgi:hypothetical protein